MFLKEKLQIVIQEVEEKQYEEKGYMFESGGVRDIGAHLIPDEYKSMPIEDYKKIIGEEFDNHFPVQALSEHGHPLSKNVYALVNRFREVCRQHDACNVSMLDIGITTIKAKDHSCKTTACHAGYYRLARFKSLIGNAAGYMAGSLAMARDLGFENADELTCWASTHSALWGNEYGAMMFAMEEAFGASSSSGLTLQDVVNHWEQVGDRLRHLEEVS